MNRTARIAGFRVLSLFALGVLCGACGRAETRRSALLVTIDTIRPEVLGCYGGATGVSPHLDRLARESLVYEQARTVAPLTLPAHASMLTGLYPIRHTLRDNGLAALPAGARTLAESAREAGFQTAAFVAARVLASHFGLDQGFEVYDQPPNPESVGHGFAERHAAQMSAAAVDWLEGRDRARPFFLWVHFFDPHQPADPRRASCSRSAAIRTWARWRTSITPSVGSPRP